jgi:hypothetical protein
MTLHRGDFLKRGSTYLTVLVVSPCGRYARVARMQHTRIVEESVALKGLRQGQPNPTKQGRRQYQDVWVLG